MTSAFSRSLQAVMAALLLLGGTGCEQLFDKGSKHNIDLADQKAAAGDFKAALRLYEASLDGTERTADVHYKMALIYAKTLNSPLDAMHHFGRYLEYAPNGLHAKEARSYQPEGDRKLAVDISHGSPMTMEEAVRLKNDNLELREKLALLRAQKNFAATHPPGKPGDAPPKEIPPGANTYVVEPGDTLSIISQKMYKTKTRWKDIQEANFSSTEGTPKIKPGMTLVIPP